MILGIGLLTILWLYVKYNDNIIRGGDGPFETYTAPMFDLFIHEKLFDTDTITSEQLFMSAYVEELFE